MSERVIERVVAMADQLRDQAAEAERIGRLTDDTVKAMKAAGLIRLLQTKQYGGFEAHPREWAETVMAGSSARAPTTATGSSSERCSATTRAFR
jgi:3-hydroxy-9,10-secoandrosta-1,3,5(10)-triene-9,17-dione monooxygenase